MFTWLVGGLEHEFHFSIQLGILTPADELIFFRGVETTNQILIILLLEKVNIKVTMKKYII
jgi:hypothetical protein